MERNRDWYDIIGIIIAVTSVIIPIVFFLQTSSEEIKSQTYIIFGVILIVLILITSFTYIISKWNKMSKDVLYTRRELENIKKDLNFNNLSNDIKVRLTVLERLLDMKKNKRGQIDPRIIWWIILLILIFLFLKSIGVFG